MSDIATDTVTITRKLSPQGCAALAKTMKASGSPIVDVAEQRVAELPVGVRDLPGQRPAPSVSSTKNRNGSSRK